MPREFSQADLEAYLDEALTTADMAEIETVLRHDAELLSRLHAIHGRRDAGIHSLGEIWRSQRISCVDRETLGNYLLNVLEPDHHSYVSFHLEHIGCRYCLANLEDLKSRQSELSRAEQRQQRYFQSSAGLLKNAR
ncbi:MAG: hypothetical protein KDA92_20690 [Planctomycetales bacterium]|nr:hypothetical protein [Planctomycetales bacterium]MCA9170626.1 hypothetical protein [Planctomycetales bacterium]